MSEACVAGARRAAVCQAVGLSVRTWQRWQQESQAQVDGRTIAVHRPANQLSEDERKPLLAVANAPEFRSLPPSLIRRGENCPGAGRPPSYQTGVNISPRNRPSTVWLAAEGQLQRRGRARPPPGRRPRRIGPRPRISSGAGILPTWPRPFGGCSSISTSSWMYTAVRSWAWKSSRPSRRSHATTVVGRAYPHVKVSPESP